jgi:hypothetical protein
MVLGTNSTALNRGRAQAFFKIGALVCMVLLLAFLGASIFLILRVLLRSRGDSKLPTK